MALCQPDLERHVSDGCISGFVRSSKYARISEARVARRAAGRRPRHVSEIRAYFALQDVRPLPRLFVLLPAVVFDQGDFVGG